MTFSPIEIFELEKVFAERPYLMPEDEDELAQKLGLSTRNIRVRIIEFFVTIFSAFGLFKKLW